MTWRRATGTEHCGRCRAPIVRNALVGVFIGRALRCADCVRAHHPTVPAPPTDLPRLGESAALNAAELRAQLRRVATKPYHPIGDIATQMGFRDVKAAQCGHEE